MKQSGPSFRQSLGRGLSAFRRALPQLLIFEIVYSAATALLAKPLLSVVLQALLGMDGRQLAFNDSIWMFALSVPGVAAILLLAAIAVLVVYFEFAVVISLVRQGLDEDQRPSIMAALAGAIWSLSSLKSPGTALFALYALLLLPLANMGVTSSLLPRLSVPNFITGELTKTPIGVWLQLAAIILLAAAFICLLFVLPAMVVDHIRFLPAVRKSWRAVRAYHLRMLGVALLFALAWLLLFLLPRQAFSFFFGATSVSLWQALTYHGLSLLTPVMLLVWLAATLAQISLMPLLLAVLTACYLPVGDAAPPDEDALAKISRGLQTATGWAQRALLFAGRKVRGAFGTIWQKPFVQKHKKAVIVVTCLLLVWAVTSAFLTAPGIHDPIVVGHRGSAYAVENTLEAMQYAIDAGADYTEVDVLLSKDNVPMVVHDANLQRLSGQDVNVYDLTAAQLGEITLEQNGQRGRIPTLEEAVAYCEGKILLAVEYKLHGHEQVDLVDAVMDVIAQSPYQKNGIFLSLDYGLVSEMRQSYPDYRTGYCVYGNVGQLNTQSLLDMDIDFLLVEEWMVSPELVQACRKAWLPVYVWTVNDTQSMEKYLKDGVAGIVTDYPDTAMELLGTMYNLDSMAKPYGEDTMEIETEDPGQ